MNTITDVMILNRVKQGGVITAMRYLARIVSSNSLKLAEMVVNKLRKTIFENVNQYSYHCTKNEVSHYRFLQ